MPRAKTHLSGQFNGQIFFAAGATATKIARYESHLSRQMTQALHGLQRLQAARRGTHVIPPVALDVNVHAAEAEPINGFAKQSQFDGPAYANGATDTGGIGGFR